MESFILKSILTCSIAWQVKTVPIGSVQIDSEHTEREELSLLKDNASKWKGDSVIRGSLATAFYWEAGARYPSSLNIALNAFLKANTPFGFLEELENRLKTSRQFLWILNPKQILYIATPMEANDTQYLVHLNKLTVSQIQSALNCKTFSQW